MNTIYFKEQFDRLQLLDKDSGLGDIRSRALAVFDKAGIPTTRHEEWKYTRIGSLFNKEYQPLLKEASISLVARELNAMRLPGGELANELVFVNGLYTASLSNIRSAGLLVQPLETAAANEHRDFVTRHLGHSADYLKDGINALNTALVHGGVFVQVKKNTVLQHPVYIYHITDTSAGNVFSQPRSLLWVGEQAQVQLVETYTTIGQGDGFTNQVMEMVVETGAIVAYYKIQNDNNRASQVSTTHIRQTGKSYVHAVTISLDGDIVRNNLNVVMEAAQSEAHLYGLYFPAGNGHIDNHTVVDNLQPGCLSNQLYKGILNDHAAGVFNGKIFVRQPAQKTNAYQSNKNILLSDQASVNAKPQLEIFADDVKCSHGCTVGRLDEEGLFYLQSRGISEKIARSLLVRAFVGDIIEQIKPEPIRLYVERLISKRLEFDFV